MARTFRGTVLVAVAVGVLSGVGGASLSFYADTPSGGTIVLLAIAVFLVAVVVQQLRGRLGTRAATRIGYHPHEHGEECGHPAVEHGDHVDYLHDGHRHAEHVGHYHEHHHGHDGQVTSEVGADARERT